MLKCKRGVVGFTLIELVVAIAIVGILSAIAFPFYDGYVTRARRADAMQALLSAASAMERYKASNGFTYENACMSGEGCTNEIFNGNVPTEGAGPFYKITTNMAADNLSFTLTATPYGGFASKDGPLTLDSAGNKTWEDKQGTSHTCWPKSGNSC